VIPNCTGLTQAECRELYEPSGNSCLENHLNEADVDPETLGGDLQGPYACGTAIVGVCENGSEQSQYVTLRDALVGALVNTAPDQKGGSASPDVPECGRPDGGINLVTFTLRDAKGLPVELPPLDAYTSTTDAKWQAAVSAAVATASTVEDASGSSLPTTPSTTAWITAWYTEIAGRDAGLPACSVKERRGCFSAAIALYAAINAWIAAQVLPSDQHLATATFKVASVEPGACPIDVPETVFASRAPVYATTTLQAYLGADSTWPSSVGIANDVAFTGHTTGVFTLRDACGADAGTDLCAEILEWGDPSPCNCYYPGWP